MGGKETVGSTDCRSVLRLEANAFSKVQKSSAVYGSEEMKKAN